ncbi:MAG: CPBP family intramembrane metalloprotease [Proteobacteria bacterium]|nr:CPBP family intramembrane metalloprotease [Pseudomonadota bacterium]
MDQKTVWRYFGLVFVLSSPAWLAGALAPDALSHILGISLPLSAVMAFLPAAVALFFSYRAGGRAAAMTLLQKLFEKSARSKRYWFLTALLFMPAVLVASYGLLRVTGEQLPAWHFSVLSLPGFFLMFFVGAVGEELGWQGYVFPLLRQRWNALESALLLGSVWALWHLIPFFQTGHSVQWVAWHFLVTILLRVVTVWLFANAGGSVLAAVLFHAMSNVGMFLFPNYGSHYDPFTTFVVLALAAGAIAFLWGPATLARFRYGRHGLA